MAQYRSILWGCTLSLLLFPTCWAGIPYEGGVGHGAWFFSSPPHTVAHVADYSEVVPRKGTPMRLLLVHAGEMALVEGAGQVTLTLSNAVHTARLFTEPIQVFARLHVSTELAQATDLDWQALGQDCLQAMQAHAEIPGLLLDADAAGPGLAALGQALLQQTTNRVVALAAPQIDADLVQACDLVIYKAYNLSGTPRRFRRKLAPLLENFLTLMQDHSVPYLIALPAAATALEFETQAMPHGRAETSGVAMSDYVRSSLLQIESYCPLLGANFRGFCLWAYFDEEEHVFPGTDAVVTPSKPTKQIYRLINLPPCR